MTDVYKRQVEGHALLRAHLIQTALNRGHDLVQGSMIHIVDDAHLSLAGKCTFPYGYLLV